MFASATTKTVSASDPAIDPRVLALLDGATVVLQKLGGRAVEMAQAAHSRGVLHGFNGRGWAGKFMDSLAKGTATEAQAKAVLSDPVAGYDRQTVIREGIQSWTCTVKADGKDAPKPITFDTVGDLDDDLQEYFAVEIMRLTKPHLFKTAAEQETERKNG